MVYSKWHHQHMFGDVSLKARKSFLQIPFFLTDHQQSQFFLKVRNQHFKLSKIPQYIKSEAKDINNSMLMICVPEKLSLYQMALQFISQVRFIFYIFPISFSQFVMLNLPAERPYNQCWVTLIFKSNSLRYRITAI